MALSLRFSRQDFRYALPVICIVMLTMAAALMLRVYAHRQAVAGLRSDAFRIARQQERLLGSELQRFRLLPIVLVEYPDVGAALRNGSRQAAGRLDEKLRGLAERTGAPVIYAIDRHGQTIAASNAGEPDSFVGRNYLFRPYFRQAMEHGTSEYFALGNTSHRPGLFLARRIGPADAPEGVIVVKVEFDRIVPAWASDPGQSLLIDNHGVVVVTTDPHALFTAIHPLTRDARGEIEQSQQFGGRPLRPSPYRLEGGGGAVDGDANRYIVGMTAAPLPGWRLVHLLPSKPALRAADSWVRSATALIAAGLIGLTLVVIWRRTRAWRAALTREALEGEVARRTAELRASNDRLTVEIAERTRADQRFRAAREELAQANRLGSLGSITAGVAHEINQPVAAIRTLADNARTFLSRTQPDKAAGNLATIVELTERIGSIVQEMRRFARRGAHELGPVSLDEVLDGTMLLIGDRFRSAGVALERPADGLPRVMAGRVRLEQVLVNLLQNALDAVDGRATPRVRLTIAERGNAIELTVEDNGPGLDPTIATEIFTPFVTGKPDGLGLGLGIARDIMTEFGGMLETIPSMLGGAGFRLRMRRV